MVSVQFSVFKYFHHMKTEKFHYHSNEEEKSCGVFTSLRTTSTARLNFTVSPSSAIPASFLFLLSVIISSNFALFSRVAYARMQNYIDY